MRLGERQEIHTDSIGKLILFINSQPGYSCRMKGAWCPNLHRAIQIISSNNDGTHGPVLHDLEPHLHAVKSFHYDALATDLPIFKNGVWLKDTPDYKFAGDYWESLHPLNTWGGRWMDGNHFSTGEGKR